MNPTHIEIIASALFAIAILHTFMVSSFEKLSHSYPKHAGLFHLLAEVEVVFGFWALVLVMIISILNVLKKPYYDELKKNRFKFPEEIENCLRIGFRDNLIDEIMKPTF